MGDTSALGFGHFIAQSDIVARVLLAVLVIMSAISWYLIVYKGISQVVRQKRSSKFLTFFWSATSLEAVQNELSVHGVHEPFGHLAAHAHACPGASRQVRRRQARGGGHRAGVPDAHHQEGARRGDDGARERPHHARHHRRHRAVRRPVRHGVGRLSRAGGDRHVGLGHARQGRGPGRRGADHDRHRPCRRSAGGHGLQLADPLQPRADDQARRLRLRAAELPADRPHAAGPGPRSAGPATCRSLP